MSKLQSKDFLNISCVVEGKFINSIQNKIGNFNKNISTTYVPIKDVYKTGGGSGLLGLGIGGAGVYTALHNKLADDADSSETVHSLHDKLASILNNDHES
jgi:hypothetical protein